MNESEYWKQRCELAEKYIEKSPCDTDINKEQIIAHRNWTEFKKLPMPALANQEITICLNPHADLFKHSTPGVVKLMEYAEKSRLNQITWLIFQDKINNMNVNNGNLVSLEDARRFSEETCQDLADNFVEVSEKDMTEKQKQNNRVSLKDRNSELGKILTRERRTRKISGLNNKTRKYK